MSPICVSVISTVVPRTDFRLSNHTIQVHERRRSGAFAPAVYESLFAPVAAD